MKRVAIIENGWGKFISYAWVDGCKQYIDEHNLDVSLYTFSSFGDFYLDEKYNIGEYNITNLPDFKDFDGIILELTNIVIPEVKEHILKKVIESGVPAVSLVEEVMGLPYAGIDNYTAIAEIVEHMIEKHGVKTINFVGGPEASMENQIRYKAYKDVLRKHGIPVEKERVYHGDFEVHTGVHAFYHFFGKKLMPEAFICANDNIAVGLIHEAKKHGFEVPKDFSVTGFDNFDKASYYTPRITTVDFAREDIAYSAMGMLERIWNGEKDINQCVARTTAVFQESCGCVGESNSKTRNDYVISRIFEDEEKSTLEQEMNLIKRELIKCDSFSDIANCLPKCFYSFNFEEMYMVVNRDLLDNTDCYLMDNGQETNYRVEGYPDDMVVLFATDQNGIMECPKWDKKQMIPVKEINPGDIFLFSPLHFRDKEIGFIAFKNCEGLMGATKLYDVINVFLECMENIYHRMILSRMNRELSRLYMLDSLTGLYNRMAYTKIAEPAFVRCVESGQPFSVLFIDMDELKYVNDTYGHDMGNLAIKTISEAMLKVCPDNGISMRYGGDEFVMLVPNCDRGDAEVLINKLKAQINQKKQALDVPFPIEVSIGFSVSEEVGNDLNSCINEADASMYLVKKEHKMKK